MKDAVSLQLLSRIMADAAIPPRPVKREIVPLEHEQMWALLDATRGDRREVLYILAITTGMRQGELRGLQWRDIDLDAGTLRVNRSVYDGVISPPESSAVRRTAALRQHRLSTAKQRTCEWVPNSRGTTIGHQNLHNRSWKPLLKRAGLPHSTRFHDLRHSCISLLLARGVPIKIVSELAGHADVNITLSVYGHVLPDAGHRCRKRSTREALRGDRSRSERFGGCS